MPSLVLFDLDNTLIDRAVAFGRWAGEFASRRGLGPEEIDWLTATDDDGYLGRPAFMEELRQRYGLPGSADDLLVDYRAAIVEAVSVDRAVPPALDALRTAGWRIAVATNGGAGQQAAKLRRTGLDRLVDAVAISEEVGVSKPARRLFQVAAERCGARLADGGWMLGDCPDRDIGGGRQAGLHTIWMRRGRAWDRPAFTPTTMVDDIPAAVAVLLGAR